jgi:gliding motility-associated-like protein
VAFNSPVINNIQTAVARYPATADISFAFTHDSKLTYSYYTDAAGSVLLNNYTSVKQSGTYYIKATNSMGCSIIMPVTVNILPPYPSTVTAPTAFTPNGDGINDQFKLVFTGSVTFGKLSILNRYGQLVYTSKDANATWDGTLKGQAIPDGVYYWTFTGTDDYYKLPVSKSGSITIIR